MKRGGGGEERRERLHATIMNLKYSVHQPTEPLDWFKIGRMIETRLLLVIDYFKMANDEEDLQRALDFLAQKGFERKMKEEKKSVLLQLMRGVDPLGVLPKGFGKSLIFQLLAVAKKGSIVVVICPLISIMKDQVLEATSTA